MQENVMPLCPDDAFEQRCASWVQERVEWDAFTEISGRYIELMTEALKSDDVWEPIRVMARCERIMGVYISTGNDRWFSPLHRRLQDTLYLAHRRARRVFIRAALTGRDEPTPYDRDLQSGRLENGPDAEEDRAAVERHLREGARLFEGLRKREKLS
jgi:hypothetical protein